MREVIYTGIFLALAVILVILLIVMFRPKGALAPSVEGTEAAAQNIYTPGVYTTPVMIGDCALDVEVTVDANHINAIRLVNLSDSVTAMYPLVQPALEDLAAQICEKQSTEGITCPQESRYTFQALLQAVQEALETADSQ